MTSTAITNEWPTLEAANWRPVPGYEGVYEVSDQGHVKSLHSGKFRNSALLRGHRKNGYVFVCLCREGESKKRPVHQLVMEAFHGPRPEGLVTRHLNSVRHDNRLANLAWGTPADNMEDRRRSRPRYKQPKAQIWNR